MTILTETAAKQAFKKIFGLGHTGNEKEPGNEAQAVRQFLHADEFPSESIPLTAGAVADRILACTNVTSGQLDSELTLTLDASSNGKAYFVEVPTGHDLLNDTNPFTGVNYIVGDRVAYIIPKKFGSSWRPILKDNGTEVAPSASEDWFLDEFGIVVSEDNLNLGSTGTLNCHVYVGRFVSTDLADRVETLRKAGDTQLTGDITLSAGANITITQVGQDIEIAAAGAALGVQSDGTPVDTAVEILDFSTQFTLAESPDHDIDVSLNLGAIDHDSLLNFETNEHFTEASIDHVNILNVGTNTHAQIDTHIADVTIHFTEASVDHGSIGGLTDDDHTQYLLVSGARALTGNWDAGSFEILAETFQSDVATGTAPFTVASTTQVSNLNASFLEGKATGVSGNTIPLLDGSNTWSANQIIQNASSPTLALTDTTNTVTMVIQGGNTIGVVGTATNHGVVIITNSIAAVTFDEIQNAAFSNDVLMGDNKEIHFGADEDAFIKYVSIQKIFQISANGTGAEDVTLSFVGSSTSSDNTDAPPINITSGISSGANSDSGPININTNGAIGSGTANSGAINFTTGASTNAASGDIGFTIGSGSTAQGVFRFNGGLTNIGNGTFTLADGDNDLGVQGDFEVNGQLDIGSTSLLRGNLTIGDGAAGVDYSVTFVGETSTGSFNWDEGNDFFDFHDDIFIPSGEAIFLGATSQALFPTGSTIVNLRGAAAIFLDIGGTAEVLIGSNLLTFSSGDSPTIGWAVDGVMSLTANTSVDISKHLTISDNAVTPPLRITERSAPPSTPTAQDIYLDDGTGTGSGNPGWRRYTGAVWEDITAAAGGGGSPGGADTQLQFNDGGSFGGVAELTWDDTNFLLGAGTTTKLQFRDAGMFIQPTSDGRLLIEADILLTLGVAGDITVGDSTLRVMFSDTDLKTDLGKPANRFNDVHFGGDLVFGPATELTIAAGIITITGSYHSVDNESDAAADDVDTINGGQINQVLILRSANDARSQTYKDGTGNLRLAGDFTADDTDDIFMVFFDGANWLQMIASNNS